jgi:uncharacterized protein (DUF2062 family)
MEETTVATVLDGLAVAHQVAAATGLPLRLLAAPEAVAEAVAASLQAGAPPLVPIRRQLLAPFRRGRRAVMAT